MDNLNFATYARAIEKALVKVTQLQLVELLLKFIVEDESTTNRIGQPYKLNDNYACIWLNKKKMSLKT